METSSKPEPDKVRRPAARSLSCSPGVGLGPLLLELRRLVHHRCQKAYLLHGHTAGPRAHARQVQSSQSPMAHRTSPCPPHPQQSGPIGRGGAGQTTSATAAKLLHAPSVCTFTLAGAGPVSAGRELASMHISGVLEVSRMFPEEAAGTTLLPVRGAGTALRRSGGAHMSRKVPRMPVPNLRTFFDEVP